MSAESEPIKRITKQPEGQPPGDTPVAPPPGIPIADLIGKPAPTDLGPSRANRVLDIFVVDPAASQLRPPVEPTTPPAAETDPKSPDSPDLEYDAPLVPDSVIDAAIARDTELYGAADKRAGHTFDKVNRQYNREDITSLPLEAQEEVLEAYLRAGLVYCAENPDPHINELGRTTYAGLVSGDIQFEFMFTTKQALERIGMKSQYGEGKIEEGSVVFAEEAMKDTYDMVELGPMNGAIIILPTTFVPLARNDSGSVLPNLVDQLEGVRDFVNRDRDRFAGKIPYLDERKAAGQITLMLQLEREGYTGIRDDFPDVEIYPEGVNSLPHEHSYRGRYAR